jgi:hypothetical protein
MADTEQQPTARESEQTPLLGGPGDATQQNKPIYHNFVIGTGVVAQGGAWILAAIVWGSVFSNDLSLFSAHPVRSRSGLPVPSLIADLASSSSTLQRYYCSFKPFWSFSPRTSASR